MLGNGKVTDRIAFVMWSFFSYLFLAWGTWMFCYLLFYGEYFPSAEYNLGNAPKIWEVLWDIFRALFFGPALWILPGLLFRRFALQSKTNRFDKRNTRFSVGK